MNPGRRTGRLGRAAREGAIEDRGGDPHWGLHAGYGARLAYGCNIGAYFGVASLLSLHG
ncbi:MAG: Sulfur transporter [uncultured Rubrobacteraceae bacterium]|uniref:Sulfur transporter n=1 Tax=uncultured Rubrobacteraceae bacterium TaxID=349277 RepID=A0A6J4QHF1_9ACTN|nr:MAG: Sulfur transporter [uncultured Rubrobacteraceae bacterium]